MKPFKYALLFSTSMALAQPALAQGANEEGAYSSGSEIIVTANKREESLNDVGLTITAISGDALKEQRISTMEDLSAAVPGLVFASSTANTPILTIRGIGFNDSTLAVYPAVSVYLDEAPLPFPVMGMHAAYDVQRVEVLKGPQGTLFGQNSTGGAINFVANKPTDTLEAGFDLGYGRYDRIEGNGYISGPLSDSIGARLAFTALHSDDWQKSASRPGDTNGSEEYYAGRLILDFEASDRARFSLNLNAWQDRSDPQAQQHIAVRTKNKTDVNPPLIAAAPFTAENARAADWSVNSVPRSNRKQFQASLRGDFDLSDDITVTSLTNYVRFKEDDTVDADGLPLVLGDLWEIIGDIKTFTQELRVSNDPSNRLRWLIGGNYEKTKAFESQDFKFDNLTSSRAATLNINQIQGVLEQDIENIAVFGNLEFDITDRLTIKAGARYTDSTNKSANCGVSNGDGATATLFTALGGLLGGGTPFDPLMLGDCIALNFDNVPPGTPYTDTLSEDNISWRAGLDFNVTDDVLLYANASRGYKAGSFPSLPAASTWNQLLPVTQESVTAYEAGFKASLLNRRAQINGAVFYYDYKDKQVRGKLFDPVFSALDALINVDKSRLIGAELDARVEPVDGLTFSGSVTYLDSKIKQELNFDVLGLANDFSGDPLPYTPKWAYSFTAEYRHPVGADGEIYIAANVHGQSKQDSNLAASRLVIPDEPFNGSLVANPFLIEGYDLLDLRAGYDAENWRVGLWAKNVTNEYYYTSVIAGSDTFSRFAGKPATYGITFGFDFQ